MKFILIPFLFFAACAAPDTKGRNLSPAPVSPQWTQVDPNPVVSANADGTFTVKESLMRWATQARQWVPKIEEWKRKNEIP